MTTQQIGTRLRDAAVDPRPEDFPGMPGAGVEDPHGPNVRAIEVGTPEWEAAVTEHRGQQ